jgi:rSAM/selenodomain-associated transferase 1
MLIAENTLIIFIKAPRPGFVKSRLAASLGPQAAAQAYCTLVEALLANLSNPSPPPAPQRRNSVTPHSTLLCYAPDDALPEIASWLRPTWTAVPQGAGDLGQRMQRAFAEAFKAGAKRVVLIGSDCPTISAADLETAWQALASHDLVLGPATDGGYWLIALSRNEPALFDQMAWSTSRVLAETRRRADTLGLRTYCLAERADIDTEQDWIEFLRSPKSPRAGD